MSDSIVGDDSAESLLGTSGDDTIKGGGGDDNINAGDGSDSVSGGSDNDFIRGGGDEDSIAGAAGNDTISGGGGDDNILGGEGNDNILGGKGDDLVAGDEGSDVLEGGSGADVFAFDGSHLVAGDVDFVKDFSISEGDTLSFFHSSHLYANPASVTAISWENLSDTTFDGHSLENQAGNNDLKLTVDIGNGTTQTIWLVDVVNSSEDIAFWHGYFGV